MPDVKIKMKDSKGEAFTLTLTGEQYLDKIDGEDGVCVPSICPDDVE